jgi:hypothetical protein
MGPATDTQRPGLDLIFDSLARPRALPPSGFVGQLCVFSLPLFG